MRRFHYHFHAVNLAVWAMFPIGLVAVILAHPLATGGEELTRWDTVAFGNKTALFFMVLAGIAAVGSLYYNRAYSIPGKVAVVVTTVIVFLLAGWRMSLLTPFDIAVRL